ncbi:hypothetical protein NLI96_g13276 [Meripilus lineatus]|uniref:Transcriptional regulator AbiEi antitoxin N-terminal domain-containing protein n=1 Tax=Meripilus lineatus TaxID=2056292 RepID=A0AAD5UNB2_9APHY|nr:hypothetical protein NLI96_g13276 [Physisporinus lineatus]
MASKSLQRLMEGTPHGQPLDPQMLRDCGVSAQQTTYLVQAGWLQRLSKGAYLLAGDTPTRDGILAYLSRRVPGLHVGGKTALDWQGVRHNVSFRERVVLWAEHDAPLRYVFAERCSPVTPAEWRSFATGSEPERALLELASDIGKQRAKGQSLEEAMNIVSRYAISGRKCLIHCCPIALASKS